MTSSVVGDGLVVDYGGDLLTEATAVFNVKRTHRYLLTRQWSPEPAGVFVMLNPSTADALILDPTVRRCVGFARREGWGGLKVLNIFALRSTDPHALINHPDPVGAHNDRALLEHTGSGVPVVAAWGVHGQLHDRATSVTRNLHAAGVELLCLGVTADGHPRHPLYVRGDTPLRRCPQSP